jgi:ubiquinone/menaquinone biosynthesis C-methylase UbiE
LEDFWARHMEASGRLGPDYWTYFAQRLVDLAPIPEGAAVLDIGTYDGNVLLKAMKRAGARGLGIGIDVYGGGLRDGNARAIESGLENVAFARMDAACMAFPAGIYDIVLANFIGWDYCFHFNRMEFIARDSRMAEIMRVLKPGGQVGIGFWIEQCDLEWIADAFRRYLPNCEETMGKGAVPYAKENPEGYETMLRTSGFCNIAVHAETATFVSADAVTWWRQVKQTADEYFEKMPEIDQFKEQVFGDLKQFQSPAGIRFDKTAGYVFGTKT